MGVVLFLAAVALGIVAGQATASRAATRSTPKPPFLRHALLGASLALLGLGLGWVLELLPSTVQAPTLGFMFSYVITGFIRIGPAKQPDPWRP